MRYRGLTHFDLVRHARIECCNQQSRQAFVQVPGAAFDEALRENAARVEVPFGGSEDLITPDMAIGDLDAMSERASGGLNASETDAVTLGQEAGGIRMDFRSEVSHFREAPRCFDALGEEAGGQASAMLGGHRADQRMVDLAREGAGLHWFAEPFRLRDKGGVGVGGKAALERCRVECA